MPHFASLPLSWCYYVLTLLPPLCSAICPLPAIVARFRPGECRCGILVLDLLSPSTVNSDGGFEKAPVLGTIRPEKVQKSRDASGAGPEESAGV